MRKLHGNEPTAYENDVFRQVLKLQKPGAVDEVLFTWNFQTCRCCSCSNKNITGLKSLALYLYCGSVNEFGPPMKTLYSRLLE